MKRVSLAILALAAALAVLRLPAGGEDLLANGGFETGTEPWAAFVGTLDTVGSPVHGGSSAARLSGTQPGSDEVYQWLTSVAPEAPYSFSGWIHLDDPAATQVSLAINWFAPNGDLLRADQPQTASITIHKPEYQAITTGPLFAPAGASRARLRIRVAVDGAFSVYLDDFSLDGPAATLSPMPSPSPSPTPEVAPTETPTSMPTPTPALTPTETPTATPTQTATVAPTPTLTPVRTPARTPTTTPTPGVPAVFDELTNGGFELVDENGLPYGWRKFGGEIAVTEARRSEGRHGLEFLSETDSTKWVYQTVRVRGGSYYRASAQGLAGEGEAQVFVRLSWYASEDGSGETLGSSDSDISSTGSFTLLDTGAVRAPLNAQTARVRLMLRPASGAFAAAYFDDVRFGPAPAPTSTPTPAATPQSSPTPGPSASVAATATTSPAPTEAPAEEPEVFPALTNGGFEDARDDGTPAGWHKAGGEMSLVSSPKAEGSRALRFASATASTKWVYETVSVEPGAYYEASVQALKDSATLEGVFLRLSWYASENGTGNAIDSADSTETLTSDSPSFRMLSTGAVRAPDDARSAKVKLMLRPASDTKASAYFDDVRFREALPPPSATATRTPTPTPTPGLLATSWPPSPPPVFQALTNGGFEEVDGSGRPLGWDEVGARMGTTETVKVDGVRALEMRSSTESTKWVFQTVLAEPGATYEAAAHALNVDAREVFLRVSWYASDDGSGEALGSDDSTEAASAGSGSFGRLTTGPVKAPSEARSAKVRLMLRPNGATESTAYFDAVTFAWASSSRTEEAAKAVGPSAGGSETPLVLGAVASPGQPVNVRPEPAAPVAAAAGGGSDDWLVYLSLGVAGAALVVTGVSEWRRRPGRGP